jgi:hypothetical protein
MMKVARLTDEECGMTNAELLRKADALERIANATKRIMGKVMREIEAAKREQRMRRYTSTMRWVVNMSPEQIAAMHEDPHAFIAAHPDLFGPTARKVGR